MLRFYSPSFFPRLKKEIKNLRAMFEAREEKAKEYMLVHSRKVYKQAFAYEGSLKIPLFVRLRIWYKN